MFGGETFSEKLDGARLRTQLAKVASAMGDGEWHTLDELAQRCGGSAPAISARVRDLRKPKFGGHVVVRRRARAGLWQYQLQENLA
jgi:hypothetical protein